MQKITLNKVFQWSIFCFLYASGIGFSQAATINVTANAADVLDGADSSCSLREAITNINNGTLTNADCVNTGAAFGTSDTVNLPAGTYTTSISGSGEDLNASGDYDVLADVTIVGAGASITIIDGNGSVIAERVIHIPGPDAHSLSISGVTITGGNAHDGGGIESRNGTLAVDYTTITRNSAQDEGGAIHACCGTITTITNSTISDNSSNSEGGGIDTDSDTLIIINSTINRNVARSEGGGIDADGIFILTNSTVSGNMANYGGGVETSSATSTITNATIVHNVSQAGSGGGFNSSGTSSFTNSIVADNGAGLDCKGTITDNGGNIDSDGSCGTFTTNGGMVQDAGFASLADNGGPTMTHALLPGSTAIDAAPTCAALTSDQRGIHRPQGAACDIGAYEFVTPPIPTINEWGIMLLSSLLILVAAIFL